MRREKRYEETMASQSLDDEKKKKMKNRRGIKNEK